MITNDIIDYVPEMMNILENQFLQIMNEDPDFYGQYRIILSNEQQYVKTEDRVPKAIYIVVKFMSATLIHGQILLPVTINALGEENQIEVCQKLLLEFAQTYTLSEELTIEQNSDQYIVKQIWQSPQIMSNFNVVSKGFRSLFYTSGTFLLGKNSLPIKTITYFDSADAKTGENIDFINATRNFNIQLDSQGFYGTNSRTTSKSKIGTLTISLTIYFTSSNLCKKIRAIAFNNQTVAPNGIKEQFYLSLAFADTEEGHDYVDKMPFYLVSAQSPQNLGEFPLLTLTFTN